MTHRKVKEAYYYLKKNTSRSNALGFEIIIFSATLNDVKD
jgi:hypothetical protein